MSNPCNINYSLNPNAKIFYVLNPNAIPFIPEDEKSSPILDSNTETSPLVNDLSTPLISDESDTEYSYERLSNNLLGEIFEIPARNTPVVQESPRGDICENFPSPNPCKLKFHPPEILNVSTT